MAGCSSTPSAAAPTTVEVPDLVGVTMDDVRTQLTASGLKAEATLASGAADWSADAVAVGLSPSAGAQVERGSVVRISEATKGEIAFFAKPMPDLRGTPWVDMATGSLEAAYPHVQATWRAPKDSEESGTVVAQDPAPGATLKLGQPLAVTVADYSPGESAGPVSSGWTPEADVRNVCRRTKWC